MAQSKEKYNDFTEALELHVKESNEEFKVAEEESEQVLKSKIAKNIDFREKIQERLETRIEKHNETVQKSKETYQEKIKSSSESHESKLAKINEKKEKTLESISKELEKEKEKLEKTLSSLENKFVKEEKKCLTTIEKLDKKAHSFNVENMVNKAEKEAQSKIKNIQNVLSQSLSKKHTDIDQINQLIDELKNKQASLETLELISKSRVQKLKQRIQEKELTHDAQVAHLEQNKLREELRAQYDLDKIITNFEYNMHNETLKAKERKVELEHKTTIAEEELRFYEETQVLKRDRKYQEEKEHVALETIIQKDRGDNVKNNFALSNKEHKNLFIYEKALHDKTLTREQLNYKLAVEEIDIRTKELLARVKISLNEIKSSLKEIKQKINANLKIELKMPTQQIKVVESKYKTDSRDLQKSYDVKIKDIKGKLVLLDPTFDHDEIKELNVYLNDVETRQKTDTKELEDEFNKIRTAYENKIEFANKRSEYILNDAQKLHDEQETLLNKEIELIKENAEQQKQHAKDVFETIQQLNNTNLEFSKEINELAVSQNDELVNYLVELSQSNIDAAQADNDKRDEMTLSRFEERVKTKKDWFNKQEASNTQTINEIDSKLSSYTKMVNKKLDSEKKDVERRLYKLDTQLKNSLNKLSKDHYKVVHSFDKAMKDAELEFSKENMKLLNEQSALNEKIQELASVQNITIDKNELDIFYKGKKKKAVKKDPVEEVEEVKKEVVEEVVDTTETEVPEV